MKVQLIKPSSGESRPVLLSHPLCAATTTKQICLNHEVKLSKITVIARKDDWEDRGRPARAYMVQYIHQNLFSPFPNNKLGRTPCLYTPLFCLFHFDCERHQV